MKEELKVMRGVTKTLDVESLEQKVKAVCDKVEKAQDAYKAVMEDVYILKINKVNERYNMTFVDYIREKTGMGKSTAYSLVAIWKMILEGRDDIMNNVEDEKEAERMVKEWMKTVTSFSMRRLLELVSNKNQFLADNNRLLIGEKHDEYAAEVEAVIVDFEPDTTGIYTPNENIPDRIGKEEVTEDDVVYLPITISNVDDWSKLGTMVDTLSDAANYPYTITIS